MFSPKPCVAGEKALRDLRRLEEQCYGTASNEGTQLSAEQEESLLPEHREQALALSETEDPMESPGCRFSRGYKGVRRVFGIS